MTYESVKQNCERSIARLIARQYSNQIIDRVEIMIHEETVPYSKKWDRQLKAANLEKFRAPEFDDACENIAKVYNAIVGAQRQAIIFGSSEPAVQKSTMYSEVRASRDMTHRTGTFSAWCVDQCLGAREKKLTEIVYGASPYCVAKILLWPLFAKQGGRFIDISSEKTVIDFMEKFLKSAGYEIVIED